MATVSAGFPEVRAQLLQSLKGSGTFDHLKTQVRGYLLEEIKGIAPRRTPHADRELTLQQRAANSLILRHLRASGYSYSVSIFSTESGLGDTALGAHEICDVLHLPRTTLDAPAVLAPSTSPKSREDASKTSELMRALAAGSRRLALGQRDCGTQTNELYEGSIETRLHAIDKNLQNALAAAEDPSSGSSLEERMLRYQREVDARAAAQLEAEIARLRTDEFVRIHAEEAAKARAEVARVVREQQEWHATQFGKIKAQEIALAEAARRREVAFESSCFDHRQRMLAESEALRTREKALHEASEAQRREVAAENERLRRERLLIDERIANSLRAHELAAQQANDDRMRERRDAEQAYQHRLLQLQREEAAVREARAMAQQERQRVADELARNELTRQQRDEATSALRSTQEELANLKVEMSLIQTKGKTLAAEHSDALRRMAVAEEAAKSANARVNSLTAQLAEIESVAAMRDAEIKLQLERSALRLDEQSAAVRHAKEESSASIRRAHETTRRLTAEMQRTSAEAQERYASQLEETLSALRRVESVSSELEKSITIEQMRSSHLVTEIEALRREFTKRTGAPPTTPRAPPISTYQTPSIPAPFHPTWTFAPSSSAVVAPPASAAPDPVHRQVAAPQAVGTVRDSDMARSAASNTADAEDALGRSEGGFRQQQVVLSQPRIRNAAEPQDHGLDDQWASLATDPFSEAFESSAAKLRDLDRKNLALQRQCRTFLAGNSSALLGIQSSSGLLKGTTSGAGAIGPPRPLPSVMPLPWAATRQEIARSCSEVGTSQQPSILDDANRAAAPQQSLDDGFTSQAQRRPLSTISADDGGASPLKRRPHTAGPDRERQLDEAIAQGVAKARAEAAAEAAAEAEVARAEAATQMLRAEELRIELLKAQAEAAAREKLERERREADAVRAKIERERIEAEMRARLELEKTETEARMRLAREKVEEEARKASDEAIPEEAERMLAVEAHAEAQEQAEERLAATREREVRMRQQIEEDARREAATRVDIERTAADAQLEAEAQKSAEERAAVEASADRKAVEEEAAAANKAAAEAASRKAAEEEAASRKAAEEEAAARKAAEEEAAARKSAEEEAAARKAAEEEAAARKAAEEKVAAEKAAAEEARLTQEKAEQTRREEAARLAQAREQEEQARREAEERKRAEEAAKNEARREAELEEKRVQYEKEAEEERLAAEREQQAQMAKLIEMQRAAQAQRDIAESQAAREAAAAEREAREARLRAQQEKSRREREEREAREAEAARQRKEAERAASAERAAREEETLRLAQTSRFAQSVVSTVTSSALEGASDSDSMSIAAVTDESDSNSASGW